MSALETVLPQLLPITAGPYALELIEAAGGLARLRFRGLERYRGSPERPPFSSEDVPLIINAPDDPRLEAALRAWAAVLREVFANAASWPIETDRWLGPLDVVSTHLFDKALKKKGTKKEAQFVEEWRSIFHELLPVRQELKDAAPVVDALLAENACIGSSPHASLEAVRDGEHFAHVDSVLKVTLRLIIKDEGGAIRDIKEQQCLLADRGALGAERVGAFVAAWREAVAARLARPVETLETLMPCDFTEDLLELASPKTKEQFAATFQKRWAPAQTTESE